tara:strand:+ start:210 stop:506 length:297 start_codon:yes stop_codon:yes gene_type:complete
MSKSIRIYSFVIPSEFDSKMTPQIKQILEGISESGNSEFQESELKNLINELAESGKLKTRQSPWRIFQYYRANMISAGICKMSNSELDSEEVSEAVNQ